MFRSKKGRPAIYICDGKESFCVEAQPDGVNPSGSKKLTESVRVAAEAFWKEYLRKRIEGSEWLI